MTKFNSNLSLAPLAVFRIVFGLLMFFSTLRFWIKGWIYELYILPDFHFKYYSFEWVEPLPSKLIYLVFILMLISSIAIALGWFYRVFSSLFFLSFTYIELLDSANYLNHYYFVSLVALLLVFLPAHRIYSLDVKAKRAIALDKGHQLYVNSFRILLTLVYFYAGLAKLNSDWLLEAAPLNIWLPSQSHLPLIGPLLNYKLTAYIFSWFGAFYDLSIAFFLWNKRTRIYAFVVVVIFHILTWVLFPIGVFPWVMIFSTLIFFPDSFHQKILNKLNFIFKNTQEIKTKTTLSLSPILKTGLLIFFAFQLIWPWRYLAYPGKLFWNEEGYRLGWRVMLMEKAGYINYLVKDPRTKDYFEIEPSEFLSPNQVKQLSTQPDLILQFAHFLDKKYRKELNIEPEIYANCFVNLQNKGAKRFINPSTDLSKIEDSYKSKTWILPYEY